VDAFLASVARHDLDAKPLASWQPYTLKPGESLEDVARNGNVSVQEIVRANGLRAGARILPGTEVIAPQPVVRDESKVESFPGPRVYEQVTVAPVYHRVMKRETLAGIAASYGVSADSVRAWNGGIKAARPGTSLLVRPASNQTVLTTANGERQVVGRGEAIAAAPAVRVEPVAVVASAAAVGGLAAASASPARRAVTNSRSASAVQAAPATAVAKGGKGGKAAQPMAAVLKPADKGSQQARGTATRAAPGARAPATKPASAPAKSGQRATRT